MNEQKLHQQLGQLSTTANRALGGLNADARLMLRIEKAAAQPQKAPDYSRSWKPALACAMALVLCLAIGIPALNSRPGEQLITAQSAGDGPVGNEIALNLPGDSVSIGRSSGAPAYRSLWAEGSGSFPLIGVEGRNYRLMTEPVAVGTNALGESLGAVAEFTTEPSLSGSDVTLSNAAAFGTQIHAVRDMEHTLVAAEVDGMMRLFQRVSFNGNALRGSESLADTLQISGHITAMELSGVGSITDPARCEEVFATLLDCASYESSGTIDGRQSLLIALDNGLAVQMLVRDDNLSACGTWSCPEFIEAFEAAVQ